MKVKIGMVSLGCAKNQVDAEMMLGRLLDGGYALASDVAEAELVIVNTCGFIEDAKREAIEEILALARLKQEGRIQKILVTGCLAERYKEELAREFPEVDGVVGLGANGEIVKTVEEILENKRIQSFPEVCNMPLSGPRVQTTPPQYAYLRVADGCDNCCAFCAIPLIRGPFRSRPLQDLLKEAEGLAKKGVKELLVIAQDTTRYGEDLYGRMRLPDLLRGLVKIDGIRWIRLLYCYPDRVTDELIEVMAREEKIVKYIDLPLQHCNNTLLRAMNRRGTKEEIAARIEMLREKIPGIVIRTTFIAGLPGEGEKEFEELAYFVRKMKFERMGCFAYSPEEGTPAAEMSAQVPREERQRRQQIIMAEQERVSEEFTGSMIGKHYTVLVEGYDEESARHYGRGAAEAPEIDGRVYFTASPGRTVSVGDFIDVEITENMEYDLVGVMLPETNGSKGERKA